MKEIKDPMLALLNCMEPNSIPIKVAKFIEELVDSNITRRTETTVPFIDEKLQRDLLRVEIISHLIAYFDGHSEGGKHPAITVPMWLVQERVDELNNRKKGATCPQPRGDNNG